MTVLGEDNPDSSESILFKDKQSMPKVNKVITLSVLATLLLLGILITGFYRLHWQSKFNSPSRSPSIPETPISSLKVQTENLLVLANDYQISDQVKKREILQQMKDLVVKRKRTVTKLMEDNPELLSSALFPNEKIALLPDPVQPDVEKVIVLEGKLVIISTDNFDQKTSQNIFILNTKNAKQIYLHFPNGFKIPSPGDVTFKVILLGSQAAVESQIVSEAANIRVLGDATSPIIGTKKVAVVMFNWKDYQKQFITANELRSKIFTSTRSAKVFYKEASFGKLNLTGRLKADGDIYGWYTLSIEQTCYPPQDNIFQIARESGEDLSGYDYYIYIFPLSNSIPCSAYGYESGNVSAFPGYPDASMNYVVESHIIHELGHNFGLAHSSSYSCGDKNGKAVTLSSDCTLIEYGDPFSPMGTGNRHFNNFEKARLGWLNNGNILTVNKPGSYTLYPIEKSLNGTQLIRIPWGELNVPGKYFSNSGPHDLYLDYRRPIGLDKSGQDSSFMDGVFIRLGPDYSVLARPILLNTKPDSPIRYDPLAGWSTFLDSALAVGQQFEDKQKGIKITTTSVDSDKATVNIELGTATTPTPPVTPTRSPVPTSPPLTPSPTIAVTPSATTSPVATIIVSPSPIACYHREPILSITPASQNGSPGQTISYTVNIGNVDPNSCPSSTFTANVDSYINGWILSPMTYSIDLNPGETKSFNLSVTSSSSSGSGAHAFIERAFNATEGGYNQTTNGYFNVIIPSSSPSPCYHTEPALSLTPLSQNGKPGQTLAYTVSIYNNDPASCGTSTFTGEVYAYLGGWYLTPSSYSIAIPPGESRAFSLNVTPDPNSGKSGGGAYGFTERAFNSTAGGYNRYITGYFNVQP